MSLACVEGAFRPVGGVLLNYLEAAVQKLLLIMLPVPLKIQVASKVVSGILNMPVVLLALSKTSQPQQCVLQYYYTVCTWYERNSCS